MTELAGKIAVITGGARGFGKAFGQALIERGARAVLVDRDAPALAAAQAELGAMADTEVLDVADEQAVGAAMAAIAARHGGIDILINNAGIHSVEANKSIGEMGIAGTRRLFDVNIWGVIYCTLAAQPFMAGRSGAAIVNISSMAGYGAVTAYGVSKMAVRGLTASFAHELAPSGIRVNAIAPGLMFTDTIRAELPQDLVEKVRATQILQTEGEVADIVAAMLYLVSSGARFVTGETLRVSGGATLQP
jgi:3-oxoacyl-[acyl-carrier protein] reductase